MKTQHYIIISFAIVLGLTYILGWIMIQQIQEMVQNYFSQQPSETSFTHAIDQWTHRALGFAWLILFVASILIYTLIKHITQPIQRLTQSIHALNQDTDNLKKTSQKKEDITSLTLAISQIKEQLQHLTTSRETLMTTIAEKNAEKKAWIQQLAQFERAQSVAQLGTWDLKLQTWQLTWSIEMYRIYELDLNTTPTYQTFMNLIHPEDRESMQEAYASSLKNKCIHDIEHRLLMPDGRIKWVHERCEHHFSDDGTPLYSTGSMQDITTKREKQTVSSL